MIKNFYQLKDKHLLLVQMLLVNSSNKFCHILYLIRHNCIAVYKIAVI